MALDFVILVARIDLLMETMIENDLEMHAPSENDIA